MYQLYEMGDSGNCYKVRLLLNQLELAYERVPTDIFNGESRTAEFLSLNPNGKVPLLVLPDGRTLAESNAILCYLAQGSGLLPSDSFEQGLVLQWLFFEQYSHEPFIATNRAYIHLLNDPQTYAAQIEANHPRGLAALAVMEQHLETNPYFVQGTYSIADIALYAYTHVAHQGNYDLGDFPNVRAWLVRVSEQPRHVPIDV
ncbi:MAG: glutathione S-transferase family protein [Gammaproteobacteria bacterium]|nr:glutathione S-transferase family protein [Gammaproteobacteria bacterium]